MVFPIYFLGQNGAQSYLRGICLEDEVSVEIWAVEDRFTAETCFEFPKGIFAFLVQTTRRGLSLVNRQVKGVALDAK